MLHSTSTIKAQEKENTIKWHKTFLMEKSHCSFCTVVVQRLCAKDFLD